jgi:hypothetical protein
MVVSSPGYKLGSKVFGPKVSNFVKIAMRSKLIITPLSKIELELELGVLSHFN